MNDKKDLQPTLMAMSTAIRHKNSWRDEDYRYLLGAEMVIDYIYDWAGGGRDDVDLLELLEITVRNTQLDVAKKAQQGES